MVQSRRYQLPPHLAGEEVYFQLSPNKISFCHENKLILETGPDLGAIEIISYEPFDGTRPPVFGAADPALQPAGSSNVSKIGRGAGEHEELTDG